MEDSKLSFSQEEIDEFKTEAQDLLDLAERSLLALDSGSSFTEQYQSLFRAFHSIKGAAGMMELTALQTHMHHLENILTETKDQTSLSQALVDFFLKGTDAARHILNGDTVHFDYNISVNVNTSANTGTNIDRSPAPKSTAPEPRASGLGRVLVFDDEPDLLEMLQDLLTGAGFEVKASGEPARVIEFLKEFEPDVVISDVAMPQVTGHKVLEQVHAHNADIPVIFISGCVTKEALLEAINLGVHAVIEKPFNISHVITTTLNASRKHQLNKLLNTSINLLMYQYSDLDAYLKNSGKEDVRRAIREQIEAITEKRRALKHLKI
ncbi:MAG: response regulator [Calothrix sp. SM1_5_4]|nr:response regulator [Calothrix sp. SM1_5_4]